MISTLPRRAAALVAVAALMSLSVAGPAVAGSSTTSRSSGQTAWAGWIEYGTLPGGVAGNVHIGYLYVDASSKSRTDVFGSVSDYTCDPGETPGGGGHGDEPPEENFCDYHGDRFISNENAVFTLNKKVTQASLIGTLRVEGHGPDGPTAPAFPPVDMRWTAIGSPSTQKVTETFSDGTYSYTYRFTTTGAQAAITGRIGAMGFTDDADDQSSGFMGTYRNMSRERTR